jgi:hypothetical protein
MEPTTTLGISLLQTNNNNKPTYLPQSSFYTLAGLVAGNACSSLVPFSSTLVW